MTAPRAPLRAREFARCEAPSARAIPALPRRAGGFWRALAPPLGPIRRLGAERILRPRVLGIAAAQLGAYLPIRPRPKGREVRGYRRRAPRRIRQVQHQGNAPVQEPGRVPPPEGLLDAQGEHRVCSGPIHRPGAPGGNLEPLGSQLIQARRLGPRQQGTQHLEHRHRRQGRSLGQAPPPRGQPGPRTRGQGRLGHVRPRIPQSGAHRRHPLAQRRGFLPPAQLAQPARRQMLGRQRGSLLGAEGRGGGGQRDRPQGTRARGPQCPALDRRPRVLVPQRRPRRQRVLLR